MDPRFLVTREEFHDLQADLKQVQFVQSIHADRLLRLEKRQADDAALKSVWNSPFPSTLGGTPQYGPVQMPSNEVFDDDDDDDLDNQGQSLLGSLHLEADDEPIRRGAASRANSVRFDESALQGSSWGGHSGRHSGEFARPGSGLGSHPMMERSYSHKSDGRHSSAGHSVHSMHSGLSGRASSLGLDTNFIVGEPNDDSPLDMAEPPPGFFILGSVPSIIRCWLSTNFASSTLLYAAVCTGAQSSSVELSLLEELSLTDEIHRDVDGAHRISLPVYLAEARATQPTSRSPSPAPQLPSVSASFQVVGMGQAEAADAKHRIRIFIGSETLRMHSADILFSRNLMTLYGNDRVKLSVPFVRPEDDTVFKHLQTTHGVPERPKLNAAAPEFVSSESPTRPEAPPPASVSQTSPRPPYPQDDEIDPRDARPRNRGWGRRANKATPGSAASENGVDSERQAAEPRAAGGPGRDSSRHTERSRRNSSTAIWGPWRQSSSGGGSDAVGGRENGPLSGYQPAGRGSRGMKILKPSKHGASSSTGTGAANEPAPAPRTGGEQRRKSQASVSTSDGTTPNGSGSGSIRWDMKRIVSSTPAGSAGSAGSSWGSKPQPKGHETAKGSPASRSAKNPLGNASAFASWMSQASRPKAPEADE